MTIRIAVNGAAGRMGRRLVALSSTDTELRVAAALESPDHPDFGKDAGVVAGVAPLDLPISGELPGTIQAVIDFSVPSATLAILTTCVQRKFPIVVATTGLDEAQKQHIRWAAQAIPVVWAPNMSLAVNLTMKMVEMAAGVLRNLASGADVEIIERHHRFKEDAPSGTALKFGEIIATAMGQTKHVHGRKGMTGKRPLDEIGYHALRTGDNPGEHTIVFGLLGETIELTVRATNRDCYAIGALAAAKFVAKQKSGLYNMYDVLGL